MKTKLLALLLLAGSSVFAAPAVFFGVGVGVAAPPPPVVAYEPAPYGYYPGYSWVGGYWYPVGPRYYWHAGYWARPPYARAYWEAPRYYGGRYYHGYWHRR
ncbi:MAG: YXWGXW repeat-containing protein [Acidobacteriaceae bacterium]|nr:YXWGXW repeat-containing protein [Acidobacteriaceae bacterium]